MDSLDYMPALQTHLVNLGTSYKRHYCTVSLCCPSRASLWTGKAAHNTNVTDLAPPYGRCERLSFWVLVCNIPWKIASY